MSAKEFKGFFAFNVTPTEDDGESISESRLRRYLDYQIEQGVHGFSMIGSTGGVGSFDEKERLRVIDVTVKHVNGHLPVLAGVSAITTTETVCVARRAEGAGADGIFVVPITYWPLIDDEIYGHYAAVASSVDLPVCVYNNPWTTGTDISPAMLARLAKDFGNVRYVKESSADLTRISEIRRLTNDVMKVFCGWDSLALESFAAGAVGWFGGMGALSPAQCVKLYELACVQKDLDAARAYFDQFYPLLKFLCDKSHIRVAHTGLDILGVEVGPPRRPLRMLQSEDRAELERILRDFGMLK